jgi:hypothetical protein
MPRVARALGAALPRPLGRGDGSAGGNIAADGIERVGQLIMAIAMASQSVAVRVVLQLSFTASCGRAKKL